MRRRCAAPSTSNLRSKSRVTREQCRASPPTSIPSQPDSLTKPTKSHLERAQELAWLDLDVHLRQVPGADYLKYADTLQHRWRDFASDYLAVAGADDRRQYQLRLVAVLKGGAEDKVTVQADATDDQVVGAEGGS